MHQQVDTKNNLCEYMFASQSAFFCESSLRRSEWWDKLKLQKIKKKINPKTNRCRYKKSRRVFNFFSHGTVRLFFFFHVVCQPNWLTSIFKIYRSRSKDCIKSSYSRLRLHYNIQDLYISLVLKTTLMLYIISSRLQRYKHHMRNNRASKTKTKASMKLCVQAFIHSRLLYKNYVKA